MAIFPAFAAEAPVESDSAAFSRLYFGLQPVADRDAERTINLIEELFAGRRYSEAAPLLQKAFSGGRDLTDFGDRSLRGRLADAISALPPEGVTVLLNVLEGAFEARLAEAKEISEVRSLIAGHPPELFGAAGLVDLAAREAARGDARAAAEAYRRARELDAAQQRSTPEWRLLREAANWLRVGERANAEALTPLGSIGALITKADSSRRFATRLEPPSPSWDWRAEIADPSESVPSKREGSAAPNRCDAVAALRQVVVASGSRVVSVDQDSGKRLWTVECGDSAAGRGPRVAGLSTNGRLVFAIAPSLQRSVDFNAVSPRRRRNAGWYRGRPPRPTANRIVALELATGGKIRWSVDGADPDSPLHGTTFLGPPLPVGARLYAVTSSEQTIRVVEFDAATGRVDWVQPLVRFERPPPPRAADVPITPSLGDRFLYCPTGRGAVVAVDLLQRRLAWIHYAPVGDDGPSIMRRRGLRAFGGGALAWDNDDVSWREASVVPAGDLVLVATPAAPGLQAVQAADGQIAWQRAIKRGAYLAGVFGDTVVVSKEHEVTGLQLEDGEPVWTTSLDADAVSGPGLVIGGTLLSPLLSNRFALVEVTGDEAGTLRTLDPGGNPLVAPPRLGGLLAVEDGIVSFDQENVALFPQSGAPDIYPERFGELARLLSQSPPSSRVAAERLAKQLLRAARSGEAPRRQAARLIASLGVGPRFEAYASLLRIEEATARADDDESLRLAQELAGAAAGRVVIDAEPGLRIAAERLALGDAPSRATRESSRTATSPDSGSWTDWATRRVAVSTSTEDRETTASTRSLRRSSRNDGDRRPRRMAIDTDDLSPDSPGHWLVAPRNNRPLVLGVGRFGEIKATIALREDRRRSDSTRNAEPGAPRNLLWRDRLVLRRGDNYAVYLVAGGASGAPEQLWLADSETVARQGRAEPNADSERPIAVGPWGIVGVAPNELRCRNHEDGRLVWSRDLAGLGGAPPRVLADDDTLYLAGESGQGWRLSAWTGRQLSDDWKLSPAKGWKAYRDGSLLVEERSRNNRHYAIYRVGDASNRPAWTREVNVPTAMALIEGEQLALLAKGRFSVVDLASASEVFSTELPERSELAVQALRVSRNGDCLLVEVDRTGQMIDTARGAVPVSTKPLLTGQLHCLDAATGESRWPAPAEIDRMALLQLPLESSPLLLLARASPDSNDSSNQSPPRLSMVALAAATGATVYTADNLPADLPVSAPAAWAQVEDHGRQRLLARIGRNRFDFRTTDFPAPPRPPRRARVEDPEAMRPDFDILKESAERLIRSFDTGSN